MKKPITIVIVFFLTAIFLFILTYQTGYIIYKQEYGPVRRDISWGISIKIAVIIFTIISIIVGGLQPAAKKTWQKFLVSTLGFLVFGLFFLSNLSTLPYRTSLLLISAFVGLFVPIGATYFLSKKRIA